ncbi:MAG: hypothetical protein ACM3SY_17275 [Candidatus Omnitrophota bacterium]
MPAIKKILMIRSAPLAIFNAVLGLVRGKYPQAEFTVLAQEDIVHQMPPARHRVIPIPPGPIESETLDRQVISDLIQTRFDLLVIPCNNPAFRHYGNLVRLALKLSVRSVLMAHSPQQTLTLNRRGINKYVRREKRMKRQSAFHPWRGRIEKIAEYVISWGWAPFLYVTAFIRKYRQPGEALIIWGGAPIINIKYWSGILKKNGYHSLTLVRTFYPDICKREDFDLYYEDLIPRILRQFRFLRRVLGPLMAISYALKRASVVHCDFTGAFLSLSPLKKIEARLFKLAGIKTVVCPYGSDALMYSKITDLCVKHILLQQYPQNGAREKQIEQNVRYWEKHADVIIAGTNFGKARWDCVPASMLSVNASEWKTRETYSTNDGKNGVVTITHSSNHRIVMGTEFLIEAVENLKKQGFLIRLILLEKLQNSEVLRIIREESDIHVGQLANWMYGLSEIEAMANGVPVLSNLCNKDYLRLYYRYSYLNECPILATSPETVEENLRIFITHPGLREELGRASRKYVEKYHSEKAALYLFQSIYDKIVFNKPIELLELYHPVKSAYNNHLPRVAHPLRQGKLPRDFLQSTESPNGSTKNQGR